MTPKVEKLLPRIIPAYAGSTYHLPLRRSVRGDHPRIRGEHSPWRCETPSPRGSSPHTRGAPPASGPGPAAVRIIPAYAGSTAAGPSWCRPGRDHPRIRGEHTGSDASTTASVGSSPHTRGAPVGTSPRMRQRRIIPAYAGSTPAPTKRPAATRDHPRIRGEHSCASWTVRGLNGSSPHTRGARTCRIPAPRSRRIIPAYAGSTNTPNSQK